MEDKDKKVVASKNTDKSTKENKGKTPQERKEIIEKNRFGGYYKTKKRFIN